MAPYTRQGKNGKWSGQYRDATGRKRYTGGHPSKKAAERAATLEEDNARRGQRRDPTSHKMRYEQWYELWWPTRGNAKSTDRSDLPRMTHHVLPRWGRVRLSEISRIDVQAWVIALHREPQPPRGRPLGASTVRHCLTLLSTSLRAAVQENILDGNPCADVRKPNLPLKDRRYLEDDEIEKLFAELDGWRRLLVELLLDSGLRIGEASGLHRHRCHLDHDDPYVTVFEAWNPDARVMRPHPKGKQRRDVPISVETAVALERYWERHPRLPQTCGEAHEDGTTCRSGLAVPNEAGRPVDQSNFSNREWAAAVLSSGVIARPHDLRHTYASRAISAGITLEQLQVLMGHISFETTLGYAHLMDDAKERRAAQRQALARRKAEQAARREADGAPRRLTS